MTAPEGPDPELAPLLERLRAVGGADDTRPEAEVLDERERVAVEIRAILSGRDRAVRADEIAVEVENLHAAALERPEALGALLEKIDARRKVLGIDRQLPDPATSALALLDAPPIGHAPTGLETLDHITDGGWMSGKWHVIAGEPNIGKTSLAVQLARSALEDGWVVGFHVADVDDRSGILLRVAQAHGLNRRLFLARDPDTIRAAAAILARWRGRFHVVDESADGKTIDDTAAALLELGRLQKRHAILFVDSLQTVRLRAAQGQEPRTDKDRVDGVVRRLVEWTRKGLTIVCTCEIPRAFYTGPKKSKFRAAAPPALAAFKGSGNIEYAAWTACVLTRIRGEIDAVRVEVPKNKQGREDVSFKLCRTESRVGYEDAGELHEGAPDEDTPTSKKPQQENLEPYLERVRKTLAGMPNGFNGNREGLARLAGGKTSSTRLAVDLLITRRELLVERPEGELARLRLRRPEETPVTDLPEQG